MEIKHLNTNQSYINLSNPGEKTKNRHRTLTEQYHINFRMIRK